MEAKEYLLQVRNLKYKVEKMKVRSKEYERLADSIPSPTYDKELIDGSISQEAPFVKWVLKKCDLDKKIENMEKKLVILKEEVVTTIEQLDNEDYKNVLLMHYINDLSFEEISKRLFVSESTIFRWHRLGLDNLIVPEKLIVNDS